VTPVRQTLQAHGPLARGAFAVAVLVSLAVLFTPASGVPTAPAGVDKVVHCALFAVLASTGRWAGVPRAPLVCLLVVYGAASEVVQGMTPLARSATVADWVADVAGVLIGSLLWELAARRRTAVQ
jgi:VanZ family protein